MNSGQFNNTTATVNKAIQEAGSVPSKVIERLYLTALSRQPTPDETERLLTYIREKGSAEPRSSYGDILWALLNSSEFAFNH